MTVDEMRQAVKSYVRDEDIILQLGDYNLAISQALGHYSLFRPLPVSQILSTSINAEIPVANITGFDEGFFQLLKVEYPITAVGKPYYIPSFGYELLQTPNQTIRFYAVSPNTPVRITHYTKHTRPLDDTASLTVRDSDLDAIAMYAASVCLQMLANRYSGQASETNVFTADIAHFMSKGQDCEARAKTLRGLFYDSLKAAAYSTPSVGRVARG